MLLCLEPQLACSQFKYNLFAGFIYTVILHTSETDTHLLRGRTRRRESLLRVCISLSLADTVLTISLCRANLDLNSGKSVSLAVAVVALVLFTQTNHILVTLHSLAAFIFLSQLLWA